MSEIAHRVVARYLLNQALPPGKTAAIKEITKVTIREYSDSGQVKAYVEWIDDKGKKGRTEGDPNGTHMKALIDRAKREKVKVEKDKWASNSVGDQIDAFITDIARASSTGRRR